jgi:hypothetical protein
LAVVIELLFLLTKCEQRPIGKITVFTLISFPERKNHVGEVVMELKNFGIAIAIVVVSFLAFGGSQSAFAACKDDIAAVLPVVDKEQDPDKKQKAKEELEAAQVSAGAQDEVTCKAHVDKAREHLKK